MIVYDEHNDAVWLITTRTKLSLELVSLWATLEPWMADNKNNHRNNHKISMSNGENS